MIKRKSIIPLRFTKMPSILSKLIVKFFRRTRLQPSVDRKPLFHPRTSKKNNSILTNKESKASDKQMDLRFCPSLSWANT